MTSARESIEKNRREWVTRKRWLSVYEQEDGVKTVPLADIVSVPKDQHERLGEGRERGVGEPGTDSEAEGKQNEPSKR